MSDDSNLPKFSYLPADGWYFTCESTDGAAAHRTFQRVALWRIEDEAKPQYAPTCVGLISYRPGASESADVPKLVRPPRGHGHYVHIDELSEEDRNLIRAGRFS